jgi:hypothetical protein
MESVCGIAYGGSCSSANTTLQWAAHRGIRIAFFRYRAIIPGNSAHFVRLGKTGQKLWVAGCRFDGYSCVALRYKVFLSLPQGFMPGWGSRLALLEEAMAAPAAAMEQPHRTTV